MKISSEFGWDAVRKMVIMESDVWATHLKVSIYQPNKSLVRLGYV